MISKCYEQNSANIYMFILNNSKTYRTKQLLIDWTSEEVEMFKYDEHLRKSEKPTSQND